MPGPVSPRDPHRVTSGLVGATALLLPLAAASAAPPAGAETPARAPASIGGGNSALSTQAAPAGTTRTVLQQHDLDIPGRETLQARVGFAPGAAFPRHTHPGEEIIYVLEGSLEYEIAGKPIALKAGDVLFVPSGTSHAARNTGTTTAAELATYVLEKGKPATTIVN